MLASTASPTPPSVLSGILPFLRSSAAISAFGCQTENTGVSHTISHELEQCDNGEILLLSSVPLQGSLIVPSTSTKISTISSPKYTFNVLPDGIGPETRT